MQDDSSVKLINLHHYEKRRRQPVHWSVRFANAAQTHSEDHAIRIASREDGSMAVTWVEFDRMDPCPWPCDPDARNFLDAYMKISEKDVAAHQKQRAHSFPNVYSISTYTGYRIPRTNAIDSNAGMTVMEGICTP